MYPVQQFLPNTGAKFRCQEFKKLIEEISKETVFNWLERKGNKYLEKFLLFPVHKAA